LPGVPSKLIALQLGEYSSTGITREYTTDRAHCLIRIEDSQRILNELWRQSGIGIHDQDEVLTSKVWKQTIQPLVESAGLSAKVLASLEYRASGSIRYFDRLIDAIVRNDDHLVGTSDLPLECFECAGQR